MHRLLIILAVVQCLSVSAQVDSSSLNHQHRTKAAGYIIPSAMIVYGLTALKNPELIQINQNLQQKIWIDHPHNTTSIDDYLVFVPAAAVYGLNAINIKGKHNFIDRSMLYGMSMVLATAIVTPVKHLTKELRPDGSNNLSFPSGHTTDAFVAAEFMWQEYKDVSPLYGVAGYAVAATTGYLRLYNNKHWLSDVIAGAGIGILSTKAAYKLYPWVKKKLPCNLKKKNVAFLPYYQPHYGGISLIYLIP